VPVYDYTCTACGHLTEVIHGMSDAGPRFCPSCGAEGTMRKGFATPAVHFKGSGWAKKDRSSSSGSRARTSDSTSSSGSGGDGKASEAPAGGTTGAAADAGASASTSGPKEG